MSETPKKKTSAKKAQPAKKQGAKGTAASKTPAKRGRPKKVVATAGEAASKIEDAAESFVDELVREAEEAIDRVADEVIIRANDVKKISLRKRMLKWFK